MDSIYALDPQEIPNTPKDHTVTNGCIIIDYIEQKEDTKIVRITASGNFIKYPGELTTKTANLKTSKILWNSVLRTDRSKFMCIDINNFYLCDPMYR